MGGLPREALQGMRLTLKHYSPSLAASKLHTSSPAKGSGGCSVSATVPSILIVAGWVRGGEMLPFGAPAMETGLLALG